MGIGTITGILGVRSAKAQAANIRTQARDTASVEFRRGRKAIESSIARASVSGLSGGSQRTVIGEQGRTLDRLASNIITQGNIQAKSVVQQARTQRFIGFLGDIQQAAEAVAGAGGAPTGGGGGGKPSPSLMGGQRQSFSQTFGTSITQQANQAFPGTSFGQVTF